MPKCRAVRLACLACVSYHLTAASLFFPSRDSGRPSLASLVPLGRRRARVAAPGRIEPYVCIGTPYRPCLMHCRVRHVSERNHKARPERRLIELDGLHSRQPGANAAWSQDSSYDPDHYCQGPIEQWAGTRVVVGELPRDITGDKEEDQDQACSEVGRPEGQAARPAQEEDHCESDPPVVSES